MNHLIKSIFRRLPIVKELESEVEKLQIELNENKLFVPQGHFYSPIPSLKEVLRRKESIFDKDLEPYLGLNLNVQEQIDWLENLFLFYDFIPFKSCKEANLRYYFENEYFGYCDGIVLYTVLRFFKPKNIIEVGSGFSSALMLDINDLFFEQKMNFLFIEPFPDRLKSLLTEKDKFNVKIEESFVQDINIEVFNKLNENDILFIDSSHISKIGSDVNHLFFNILPKLKKGVLIHIHDIFTPFEYPFEWMEQGRAWNECYLLRAFLQYNESFKIVFFNSYIQKHQKGFLNKSVPNILKDSGGSIWLKKVK